MLSDTLCAGEFGPVASGVLYVRPLLQHNVLCCRDFHILHVLCALGLGGPSVIIKKFTELKFSFVGGWGMPILKIFFLKPPTVPTAYVGLHSFLSFVLYGVGRCVGGCGENYNILFHENLWYLRMTPKIKMLTNRLSAALPVFVLCTVACMCVGLCMSSSLHCGWLVAKQLEVQSIETNIR